MMNDTSAVVVDDDVHEETELRDYKDDADSNLHHLHTMCSQYADYVYTNAGEQSKTIDDSIEEMLIRLDEFKSIVEMISGDSSLCLQNTLPEVYQKSLEMQKTFHKIDLLEQFVQVVRQNLDAVEEQVSEAEAQMGAFSSIIKIFNHLPFTAARKSSSSSSGGSNIHKKYVPCEVFHTDDYISPSRSNGEEPTE